MPVKRRRERTRRADLATLDRMATRHLLRGNCFFHDCAVCPMDADEVVDLWDFHRDELLREWIAEKPGTRPERWWELDAPEPLPSGEAPKDFLRRHGLMTPEEIAAL